MAKFRLFVLVGFACLAAAVDAAPETHADEVVATILGNVAKLKAARPDAVPMAFWDFDGTIIKGDVSEGLVEKGEQRFKGLIQRTIEEGFSFVYRPEDGWKRYREVDYPRLNEMGRWISWPFNAQIYAGTRVADLDAFCVREYDRVYRKWYFASSIAMLRALEKAGVENYVVSASPELFVANAAATLPLPRERLRGIRVQLSAGYVTTQIVYPLPMGEGKVEVVRELVLARPHGVAVAAFGNSYSTDGAFLRYVAKQPSLPGGAKGTAVMVNGGKVVPGYTEHFICVDQDEVTGDAR
jgi:phosphoserine phosphatase